MTRRIGEERIIQRGLETCSRIEDGLSYNEWMDVAEALNVGREQCSRETNARRGRPYNEAFSRWLNNRTLNKKDKKGAKRTVTFATINDGVRSRLDHVWTNRINIEIWRKDLTINERAKTNHPNSVWRKWQAAIAQAGQTHTGGAATAET